MTSSHSEELRDAVNDLNREYAYAPPAAEPDTYGTYAAASSSFGSAAAMLPVHQVGAYSITVAPNLADLAARAPWNKFRIEQSHLTRVLTDMQARFPANYAFVIAEGTAGAVIDQGKDRTLHPSTSTTTLHTLTLSLTLMHASTVP